MRNIVGALALLVVLAAGPAQAHDGDALALHVPGATAAGAPIQRISEGPNWACIDSMTRENTCCLNTKKGRAWCVADARTCHDAGGGVMPSDRSVPSDVINDCKAGVDSKGRIHMDPSRN